MSPVDRPTAQGHQQSKWAISIHHPFMKSSFFVPPQWPWPVAAVCSQRSDGDHAQCMPRTTTLKGAPKKKTTSQPKTTAFPSANAKGGKVGKQGQLELNLDSLRDKAFYLVSREK